MPIYEYRCEQGHTFEVMQRFSDDPVSECKTCAMPVQKVFHPVAVHFKGKGFYNTDYGTRKRSREAGESSDSKTSEPGASSGGASSDAGGKAEPESASKKGESASSSSSSPKASD